MQIYLVGGAIRDALLGLPVTDRDWVVTGSSKEEMLALGFRSVGKSFPVFLHPKTHEEYALARVEKKVAAGYQGFHFDTSAITLTEDLKRRDLTINAIAQDENGKYIDPFNGIDDLNNRYLRHVSEKFQEDPLRVLRVARFAAKLSPFNFTIANETLDLMREIAAKGELQHLSSERISMELIKAFNTGNIASFFNVLYQVDALNGKLAPFNQIRAYLNNKSTHIQKLLQTKQLEYDLFLALTIHQSTSIDAIERLIELLKPTKKIMRLMREFYHYHTTLLSAYEYSAEALLEMLKKTDAFRNTARFLRLLDVCYCLDDLTPSHRESLQMLQSLIDKLKNNTYPQLLSKDIKGKNISKIIHKQQLEIIRLEIK
ncbi:CCA tRNA nucleotidyltransferase [Fangia hongkongensis]|uniref:CCA tRNA nucleotidyltransferase n=2 Tax=Fangia hongkongensis TaxID=270495 RepID=UPI000378EA52|nr:CCA tRNA nucleotidyltransferase [Fangia hongkongensis]